VVLFFETHKRQAEGREESSRKRGELEKERRAREREERHGRVTRQDELTTRSEASPRMRGGKGILLLAQREELNPYYAHSPTQSA